MKEKIKIIFLVFLFVLILIGIKIVLDKQNENFLQNQVLVNNINQISNTNYKVEENNAQELNSQEESINVIEVNDDNFETEVLKSEKTVLIDFYADWCGPCKVLSPIVEEIANEIDNVKVVKINIDEAYKIADKYNIMSIPTLVVIKNGEEINRSVGVISKSQIMDLIK